MTAPASTEAITASENLIGILQRAASMIFAPTKARTSARPILIGPICTILMHIDAWSGSCRNTGREFPPT